MFRLCTKLKRLKAELKIVIEFQTHYDSRKSKVTQAREDLTRFRVTSISGSFQL